MTFRIISNEVKKLKSFGLTISDIMSKTGHPYYAIFQILVNTILLCDKRDHFEHNLLL